MDTPPSMDHMPASAMQGLFQLQALDLKASSPMISSS